MATYTGIADANGDFTIPFSSNYTSGQSITVTAEKDAATKTIELFAPSSVVGGGVIQFTGSLSNFPSNIGGIKISGLSGAIGNSAFYAQSISTHIFRAATSLEIESGVTEIGNSAFYNWGGIKSLILPQTLTKIDASAFYNCTSLLAVSIPNSVTTLGVGSFQSMVACLSLTISTAVTAIPATCFSGMSAIQSLTIPANITSIGSQGFSHMTSCNEIKCLGVTPPTITANTFQSLKAGCVFKVPTASLAAYQSAANWSVFAAQMVGV